MTSMNVYDLMEQINRDYYLNVLKHDVSYSGLSKVITFILQWNNTSSRFTIQSLIHTRHNYGLIRDVDIKAYTRVYNKLF